MNRVAPIGKPSRSGETLAWIMAVFCAWLPIRASASTIYLDGPNTPKGKHTLKTTGTLKMTGVLYGRTLQGTWCDRTPMPKEKHYNDMVFDEDGYIELTIYPDRHRYVTRISLSFETPGEFVLWNKDANQILAFRNTGNRRGEVRKYKIEDHNTDSWKDGRVTYRVEDYNKDGGWGTVGKTIYYGTTVNLSSVHQPRAFRVLSGGFHVQAGTYELTVAGPDQDFVQASLHRKSRYAGEPPQPEQGSGAVPMVLQKGDYLRLVIRRHDWVGGIQFKVLADDVRVRLVSVKSQKHLGWVMIDRDYARKRSILIRGTNEFDSAVGQTLEYRLVLPDDFPGDAVLVDEVHLTVQ